MTRQTLENQRGEITFRRKLVEQQIQDKSHFEDEFDREGIEAIMNARMETTRRQIGHFKSGGLPVSPYMEIGAERGQRSLVMENDIGASGAAVDISLDMLQSCDYYQKRFKQEAMPLRVCADLYQAPFKSGSLRFIFGYQILHHFPDPVPIVAEVHRILAPGGTFYVSEEPLKRGLYLPLFKSAKSFSEDRRHYSKFRKLVDHFFTEQSCNEIEYGVVENDDINVNTWQKTFDVFAEKNIRLSSLGSISSDLYQSILDPRNMINRMLGGDVTGSCRKSGTLPESISGFIEDSLTCPVCLSIGDEPALMLGDNCITCSLCGTQYPVVGGVLVLLKPDKRRDLYPAISFP